jgi:hypothetical protein
MKQTNKFPADNLWMKALEKLDNIETMEDTRKDNLTEMFWYEIEQRIQKKELINININGLVRSGKSTAAAQICWDIKKMMKKHHNVDRPMGNKNILRDQNEYARTVKKRPENLKHECDVIDEWAEMELTGYNATIEQKFLKDFSDRQAARYYHRIACSPQATTDHNSDIILQVVPGSRHKGKTLCLLSYRVIQGDIIQPVLLGHIIIDVKETLKAKWYNEYLRKKEEKWELMNKHNVKSPRELEYAQIILATYDRMKPVAKYGLNKPRHFKEVMKEEADKRGVWFSILGDKDVMETLSGMGELLELIFKTERKLNTLKDAETKQEINTYLQDMKKSLANIRYRQVTLTKLWDKYQLIDET